MRTYEERARYILKQRDERFAKRRRIRSAITLSAVSVCSLALIVGIGTAINNVVGKNGGVRIYPSDSTDPSGVSGGAGSQITALPAETVSNPGDIHSVYKFSMPEFPDVDFAIDNGNIVADGKTLFGGKMLPGAVVLADLNGDGYRELCTDWGVSAPTTPLDRGICALDFVSGEYYVLSDPTGINEYHLTIHNGQLTYKTNAVPNEGAIGMQSALTLRTMIRVSEGYFVKRGEALPVEWVYNREKCATATDFTMPEFPGVNFKVDGDTVSANGKTLYSGMPVYTVYLADLNGDGYREICSETALGSGIVDLRVQAYDYAISEYCELYELSDRGKYDYTLALEDGVLKYKRYAYPVKSYLGKDDTPEETGVLTLSVMKRVEDNGKEAPPAEKIYPRDNSDIERILEINDDFEFTIPELPDTSFKLVKGTLGCDGMALLQGYPVHSIYLADLNGDGVREICAEYSVGSGIVDMNIFAYDPAAKESYVLSDTDNKEYLLTFENGILGYKHCIYRASSITTDEEGVLTLSGMNKFSGLCGLPKKDPVG